VYNVRVEFLDVPFFPQCSNTKSNSSHRLDVIVSDGGKVSGGCGGGGGALIIGAIKMITKCNRERNEKILNK